MATDTFATSRRALLKHIGALPLFGYIAAQDLWAKVQKTAGRAASANVYASIGVTPIINARGTWTYMTGSLELPEVRAAKQAAAGHFVDMWELQSGVSKRLAELSGAEAGMITAGAASAMGTAAAACMAGTDPAKIWQLPDHTGMKHEVIMFGGRIRSTAPSGPPAACWLWLIAPRSCRRRSTRTPPWSTPRLAGSVWKEGWPSPRRPGCRCWSTGQRVSLPIENLGLPVKMGADLCTFSGGKGLCGPQCSGLLLGRKDLIEAALANSCPWEGAVCRAHKVGKEEVMGCLAAIEAWKKADLAKLDREWNARASGSFNWSRRCPA